MNHDEAMDGKGREVSYAEAQREIEAHGQTVIGSCQVNGKTFITVRDDSEEDGQYALPLNSRRIMLWLGY